MLFFLTLEVMNFYLSNKCSNANNLRRQYQSFVEHLFIHATCKEASRVINAKKRLEIFNIYLYI